jgi:hypothetical protein
VTDTRVLSNLVRVLLAAQAPTILTFETPDYPTPSGGQWWVYYPAGGDREKYRHGGIATDLTWGFDLICVGRTTEQCLNVADKADTLLIGRQLDGNSYTSPLTQQPNGARVLPEEGDPLGPRFSLNRHYQLTTRS